MILGSSEPLNIHVGKCRVRTEEKLNTFRSMCLNFHTKATSIYRCSSDITWTLKCMFPFTCVPCIEDDLAFGFV